MIVAVTGGKGGVGKSTVAFNLGAILDAVVVDADLDMADLPVGGGPTLHDVLADRADPLAAVDESGAVALLPSGRSLAGARGADPTRIGPVFDALYRAYGAVIVDCPAGLRSDVGLPLLAAEACVLVTRPTRAALADAVRARSLATTLDAGVAAAVLNRAGDVSPEQVAGVLGAPTTAIPDSRPLATAQAAGRPVTADAPTSTAADRLATVADRVHSATNAR